MREIGYIGSELMMEDVPCRELAQRFGTPLYVYSKRSIIDQCRQIEKAFDAYDHLTCYAAKANTNRTIMSIVAGEGLGVDVGSGGELAIALAAGFPPSKITFSGVGKRDDEIEYALCTDIRAFNVESREELAVVNDIAGGLQKRARILLRVNLDVDAGGHVYLTTGLKHNKFGIEHGQAAAFLEWARGLPNIEVRGIHSHIGSQITNVETFSTGATALRDLVLDLRRSGFEIPDIDFGGGYGVQYHGFVTHPHLPAEEPEEVNLSASALVRAGVTVLRDLNCRISIQPGRSIIAHAGILLTRVLYRKLSEEKTFIVVDGGMNDLIRPSLYQAHHQIVPLRMQGNAHEVVDVVGPLCESGDFFALDRELPRVERGDYLAVLCAGAYGFVLSSNYNARPRPAEVLVDGSTMTLIRERESIDQL
jgi:diaminopimelate decarboxylase